MALGLPSYGFGLMAGVLSTLSPCVLPIVPILLGSAASVHPRAPLALAGGLALSYGVVGTSLAWAGGSLGLDGSLVRGAGAFALGLLGLVLMSSALQLRFAAAVSGIGDAGNAVLSRLQPDGLRGQFLVGLVLGVVWSPCVGPTLGAAIVLAGQGTHLAEVALLMGLFGAGAALPVLALAYASRSAFVKARAGLMQAGRIGKLALGSAMMLVAVVMLAGLDKPLEAWLVDRTPPWLTALTTRF